MSDTDTAVKPLGSKAYGHIPHLPGSRLGPGDHHCHEGQARILTEKARDKWDRIIVTVKVDGSNVAVARIDGVIVPLIRAGYPACSSPQEQHQLFHQWAMLHQQQFLDCLNDGERLCGEWLALAHGTRYNFAGFSCYAYLEPFVAFDLMRGGTRATYAELVERAAQFAVVYDLSDGAPISTEAIKRLLENAPRIHGELDPIEGAVWRCERKGKFEFIAKWVRPDKIDGKYLPEISGQPAVWNWRPE